MIIPVRFFDKDTVLVTGGTSGTAGRPYCEAIGSLMYTTVGTCPDIAFAIG